MNKIEKSIVQKCHKILLIMSILLESNFSIAHLPIQEKYNNDRQDHISQGYGKQKLPAEIHQLVKAKSRQRSAYPYKQKQKCTYLAQKRCVTRECVRY